MLLALFHEPEDDVSGGASGCTSYKGSSGTPADYRAMWRNVRERFAARGVTNAVFVMNYMGAPQWDCMVDDLWPGDDLVDWVMWDPYSESTPWSQTVGRFYGFLEASTDAAHHYTSKPWGLGEWGVWRGATQEFTYRFYDDARASISANEFPRLKLYSVFDHGATAPGTARIGYDSRELSDPVEVEHYRALANDPVFGGAANPSVPTPDPDPVTPTTGPSAPFQITASSTATSVTLRWQSAGGGSAAYVIRRDGEIVGASFDDATYEDLDVHPGSTYSYTVEMVDELGNWSPPSPALLVSVPTATDLLPPTAPSGLRATRSAVGVRLSWSTSLDDVGVVSYRIYDGASWVGTTSATTFEVAAMTPGVAHMFSVRAMDSGGNLSGPSNLAAG
ncbi:MAG: hypothetical protein AB7U39_22385 [Ilumatobacteraceae bacterium]